MLETLTREMRVSILEEDDDSQAERPSVLARLYDEAGTDDLEGPTLKSMSTRRLTDVKDPNMFLTFSPTKHLQSTTTSREMYRRRSFSLENLPQRSIDQVLLLQHGQSVYRKISSDYVRTIDHIEQKEANSIRSVEYARKRPALSVQEYQRRNREYQERLSRVSADEKRKIEPTTTQDATTSYNGLRLPGDSPLYISNIELPNFEFA